MALRPREGTGAPPVVRKAALKTTDAVDPPATNIFTPDTEFGSRFLVEVVRGCANLCRFCWAGYNYLPVRAFPKDANPGARRPVPAAYSSRVGLVSIALCDHPDIEEILERLGGMGYSISPASLRLDDLTPTIVRLLRGSGERSITIAPETGSDRLRRVINKTITNDEILASAELIFCERDREPEAVLHDRPADGDRRGSRGNSRPDAEAPRQSCSRMRAAAVTWAASSEASIPWSPSLARPTSGCRWSNDAVIERKIRRMRALMAGIDNVFFTIKSERHSFYQALLSLGDRRVAPVIEAAERNGGNWRAATAETGVDAGFFVFRDRSKDRMLPWDIIDGGMKDEFFRAEFDKALREEWTLPPKRQRENARLLPVLP